MLTLDEARAHLLSLAGRLPAERISLDDAVGRVLARDMVTGFPLPLFDASAMDGYAVRSQDFTGPGPWTRPVVGEARAGVAEGPIEGPTACRIFTGAALPAGADAVIMQENAQAAGGSVTFAEAPKRGMHLRRRGEDLAAAATAIEAGTRLRAAHVGLASALGLARLEVARRPTVSIACIGDELREPGAALDGAAIYESNGAMLSSLVRQAGARARLMPIVGDRKADLAARFAAELDACDVLITVGGVSVGEHDYVRPALEEAGVSLDFWKVKIKPGKPVAVGRRGRTIVLALPGNPAASFVTCVLFGLPLLRTLQGDTQPVPAFARLPLATGHVRRSDRPELLRSRIEIFEGFERVRLHPNQASGALSSLAWCDALALLPESQTQFEPGERVDVLRLCDA